MLILDQLLDAGQIDTVRARLTALDFADGRDTAGTAAGRVKRNQELRRDHPARQKLAGALLSALYARPEFRYGALPARVGTPLFARYTAGMAYGEHIDDPLMGEPGAMYRSDLAMTLFLSEPESYGGGELVIATPFGEQSFKLAAGSAVLYPATTRHRVNPVVDGERLVMVTWLQSMVADDARREVLYQLWQAREELLAREPDGTATARLDSGYTNLLRMWAEP